MVEVQSSSVKGEALCMAPVGKRLAVDGPIVNTLSANGRAGFAQVNANLVRSPGIQPAFDQGVLSQVFQDPYMRYGALAGPPLYLPPTLGGDIEGGAPSPAVTPVADQACLDGPRLSPAADHRRIPALDGVGSELLPQMSFRFRCARENDQAAGLFVEPVDGADFGEARRGDGTPAPRAAFSLIMDSQ
jgi:hypothetical protein